MFNFSPLIVKTFRLRSKGKTRTLAKENPDIRREKPDIRRENQDIEKT